MLTVRDVVSEYVDATPHDRIVDDLLDGTLVDFAADCAVSDMAPHCTHGRRDDRWDHCRAEHGRRERDQRWHAASNRDRARAMSRLPAFVVDLEVCDVA